MIVILMFLGKIFLGASEMKKVFFAVIFFFLLVQVTWANVTITTGNLPDGRVGQSYEFSMIATEATNLTTWSISNGNLPKGLILSNTGQLFGRPTVKNFLEKIFSFKDKTFLAVIILSRIESLTRLLFLRFQRDRAGGIKKNPAGIIRRAKKVF